MTGVNGDEYFPGADRARSYGDRGTAGAPVVTARPDAPVVPDSDAAGGAYGSAEPPAQDGTAPPTVVAAAKPAQFVAPPPALHPAGPNGSGQVPQWQAADAVGIGAAGGAIDSLAEHP